MKVWTRIMPAVPVAAALLFAGPATAQQERVVASEEFIELEDAEFAEKMRMAEERLAEAARQVAELSASRLDNYGGSQRFEFQFSDRPRLGVNIETLGDDGPVEGVSIVSVTPGSAAADAGLRAGDVLTAVNGESLAAGSMKAANTRLLDFMRGVEEGDKLKIEYLRQGKAASVDVEPRRMENNVFVWAPEGKNFTMPHMPEVAPAPVVVERFRHAFGGWHSTWGDMEVVELSEGLGRYFGTDEGLLVVSAPKSNAFKLEDGDVIQSIDGRKPTSVDHCMRILSSYQPGESLELAVMRNKRRETLSVTIPDTRTGRLATPQARMAATMRAHAAQ